MKRMDRDSDADVEVCDEMCTLADVVKSIKPEGKLAHRGPIPENGAPAARTQEECQWRRNNDNTGTRNKHFRGQQSYWWQKTKNFGE